MPLGFVLMSVSPLGAQMSGMGDTPGMMEWGHGSLILLDQLEYAPGGDGQPASLDAIGWAGGADNRLWFRAQGEHLIEPNDGEGEGQFLFGHLISSYWDALIGVRWDGTWGDRSQGRGSLVLGLVGLAPLRFEFSPTVFVSRAGDVSARLEAEYQILITQRFVAEPQLELNAAVQEVPELGIRSGLNDAELGLRLRFEIRREFAPYVGASWVRRSGPADDSGEIRSRGQLLIGLRMWR